MIFFQEQIEPFFISENNRINPRPCELIDGRKGYFLADDKQSEIESKGATVEQISKDQIKIENDLI